MGRLNTLNRFQGARPQTSYFTDAILGIKLLAVLLESISMNAQEDQVIITNCMDHDTYSCLETTEVPVTLIITHPNISNLSTMSMLAFH